MRKRLERFFGQRIVVRAVFGCFIKQRVATGRIVRCMFIENICDQDGKLLTEHMWLQLRPREYIKAPLRQGDTIQFSAEVDRYAKGNKRRPTFDYGLIRPKDVQIIRESEQVAVNEQDEMEHVQHPATDRLLDWAVIQGQRRAAPAKHEAWPRLFKITYNLSRLKVRGGNVEAQITRAQQETLYGTHYLMPFGIVTLSNGTVFDNFAEMERTFAQRGEYTITWQDEQ